MPNLPWKFLLVTAALILSAPFSFAQAKPTVAVALSWSNASGSAAWPACTATTKVACNDYYVVTDVTGSPVTLTTPGSLPATASSYTAAVPTNNVYTARSYTLTLMYKDINGAEVTGPLATCGSGNTPPPCLVSGLTPTTPPAVTGFTGTPVPAQ